MKLEKKVLFEVLIIRKSFSHLAAVLKKSENSQKLKDFSGVKRRFLKTFSIENINDAKH